MLIFEKKINQLIIFILFFIIIIINNTVNASNIKSSAVVFMYHKFGISKYPSTNITLEQFEKHLVEFSQPQYNVKSLDYIIDAVINGIDLPNGTIGISVDDADRSFLTTAWPRFKEKGFPVTLFVNTSTIVNNNKNYLNWDEIRQLKAEGVIIGAHSHTHEHLANYSIDELREEIEKSNKIFLKEIGEIPNLYAYPYGEADEKLFGILKDYKFKVAFGQHSGAVNDISNLYYLPRFSLNERYGEIERVKFAASVKGLGVYDFIPTNPHINENPPYIGFSLLDQLLAKNIECFIKKDFHKIHCYWKNPNMVESNKEVKKRNVMNNSSIMSWTANDEDLNIVWQEFINEKEWFLKLYKGIDRYIDWEFPYIVNCYDRNLVYSYREGADWHTDTEKFVYRKNYNVCIFHQEPNITDCLNHPVVTENWR